MVNFGKMITFVPIFCIFGRKTEDVWWIETKQA